MLGLLNRLFLLAVTLACSAQDLSVPSHWEQTTPHQSRDERIRIAQAGLNYTRTFYFTIDKSGPDAVAGTFVAFPNYETANMLWTMALKDRIANTQDNANISLAIDVFGNGHPNFLPFNSRAEVLTPVNWGVAALMTHLTYTNTDKLGVAQTIWDFVSQFQVTEEQALAGQHSQRNVTFSSQCNGVSVAGAVFTTTFPSSLQAEVTTINHFILLSALLAEETKNQTYLDAAKLSAQFVFKQLYDPQSQLIEHNFDLGSSDQECQVDLSATKIPSMSGEYMQALAVLADIDQDPIWESMLLQLLSSTTRHDWFSTAGGVMGDVSSNGVKGKYFRGLYEVLLRTDRTDVRDLISAFVNVHGNSILQHATINGTNFYSSKWTGPPNPVWTMDGALSSLDVLTVAIGPPDAVVSSFTTTSSGAGVTSPVVPPLHRNTKLPLALGLGLGLPACLLSLGIGVCWFLRRRRRPGQWSASEKVLPDETSPSYSGDVPHVGVGFTGGTPDTVGHEVLDIGVQPAPSSGRATPGFNWLPSSRKGARNQAHIRSRGPDEEAPPSYQEHMIHVD